MFTALMIHCSCFLPADPETTLAKGNKLARMSAGCTAFGLKHSKNAYLQVFATLQSKAASIARTRATQTGTRGKCCQQSRKTTHPGMPI